MKSIKRILTGLTLAAMLANTNIGFCQNLATTTQDGSLSMSVTDVSALSSLSDAELAAFINELSGIAQISCADLPGNGQFGNFFSLQHPEWPPLPWDSSYSDVWAIQGGYLMNDIGYDYDAGSSGPTASGPKTLTKAMAAGGISPPGAGDGGGTYTPDALTNAIPNYGTNLWIAQTAVASGNLTGIGSNTLAEVQYEIQSRTNLALQTNWQSEGFIFGSELTNWTPLSVPQNGRTNLFVRLKSWASSDGSGLPDWWELLYFGTNGVDPYGNPKGDGWNNLQKFQNGWNPNLFYTPAAPQGFTVAYNANNNTATLKWLPAPGNVTNYTIERTYYYYPTSGSSAQTVDFSSPSASMVDNVSSFLADPTTGGNINVTYKVRANYSGGTSAWSANAPLEPPTFGGNIVSGNQGSPVLVVSSMPANTTAIRLTEINWYAPEHGDYAHAYVTNLMVNVTNSSSLVYTLPNVKNSNIGSELQWEGQAVGNDGSLSANATLQGYPFWVDENYQTNWTVAPFYNGRVQLKQNLIFQLREAGSLTSFGYVSQSGTAMNPTNYVYASFFDITHRNGAAGYFQQLNPLRPFIENYFDRNFVFSFTNLDASGDLLAGTYQCPTSGTNFEAMLATNDTRWLLYDPSAGHDLISDGIININTDWMTYYTLSMPTGVHNWFGLPYSSANVVYLNQDQTALRTNVIYAGQSLTGLEYMIAYIYPETLQP